MAWQRPRPERSSIRAFSVAEVDEDQAEILLGGVGADPHLGWEAGVLGRHLDALAHAVVLPAVVEAAQAAALDPARAELGAAVRAAGSNHVRHPILAAVEREILAQEPDRFG